MRRMLVTLAVVGAVFAVTASQALAFDCTVANKPTGAGSAVAVDFPSFAVTPLKSNPGTVDQLHGGFATASGTLPDGTSLSSPVDTFVHAPTNAQAPFAEPHVIPGATLQESKGGGCDGKGLDTIETCNP